MPDEWRRPGHATGRLQCKLALPAVEMVVRRRSNAREPIRAFGVFLQKSLAIDDAALEGGTFAISAAIRSPGLGVRWVKLCEWNHPEPVSEAIARAVVAYAQLPKENWAEHIRQREARGLF